MILRDYQQHAITELAQKIAGDVKRCIFQMSTGGGKTVAFSAISQRYHAKSGKRILILVHREELLRQTDATMRKFGVIPQVITAETRMIFDRPVYIGMLETVFRRLSKNPHYLPTIGMVIQDECHYGGHRKLQSLFPDAIQIGFTATPISANKRDPLKNYYEDIVCAIDTPELIKLWESDPTQGLVQNHTYSIKGVNRKKLKIRNGEFDEKSMGDEYSKLRHVQNTIKAYERHAKGLKAIIFNCNIEHSLIVTKAFVDAGYPCRHVDGNTDSVTRADAFRWLRDTDGAILCNVGIATMGTDIPAVECVAVNRATMSMTAWKQMTGRGARPFPGKRKFVILDMGGNAAEHGDWSDPVNWRELFFNPPKPRDKLSAAPVKDCQKCEALIAAQAMTCKFCGYEFPRKEAEYDAKEVELVLITRNVNVAHMVERNEGRKDYFTFFEIIRNLATQAKKQTKGHLTYDQEDVMTGVIREKCKEWAELKGIKWGVFHEKLMKEEIDKVLGRTHAANGHPGTAPVANGHQTIRPITAIQPLITSNLEL